MTQSFQHRSSLPLGIVVILAIVVIGVFLLLTHVVGQAPNSSSSTAGTIKNDGAPANQRPIISEIESSSDSPSDLSAQVRNIKDPEFSDSTDSFVDSSTASVAPQMVNMDSVSESAAPVPASSLAEPDNDINAGTLEIGQNQDSTIEAPAADAPSDEPMTPTPTDSTASPSSMPDNDVSL